MSDTAPRIYQGHDPDHGPDGTDFLVTIYPKRTAAAVVLALRPGRDQTWVTWGPPIALADASALRLVRGDLDGGRSA